MTYRIVQWTTGNVGKRSVRAVAVNPALELVGCYAWSTDKVGRDVGDLCGIEPLGVAATNDVDALLALDPDCVVYNPMFANLDEMCRILSAGINIVSTSEFITGHFFGEGRTRIADACEQGASTIFGSGINPGFIQLFAIVSAGLSERVNKESVVEAIDTTIYNSPATEKPMGFGYLIGQPDLREITTRGSAIFRDGVLLIADALGVECDDIRCDVEYAQTTEDLHLPGDWTIEKGCVAGVDVSWKGIVGTREVIEIRGRWRKGQTLDPDWELDMGYTVEVQGVPTIKTTLSFLPPPGFVGETLDDYIMLGCPSSPCRRSPRYPPLSRRRPGSPPTTTYRCYYARSRRDQLNRGKPMSDRPLQLDTDGCPLRRDLGLIRPRGLVRK